MRPRVSSIRFQRLRALFEGRRDALQDFHPKAERLGYAWPYPLEYNRTYGSLVVKYTRARTAWRAARGWN
jgi:hypothetical protein